MTALMWASDRGNVKIVELLLDKGANVNMMTKVLMATARLSIVDKFLFLFYSLMNGLH